MSNALPVKFPENAAGPLGGTAPLLPYDLTTGVVSGSKVIFINPGSCNGQMSNIGGTLLTHTPPPSLAAPTSADDYVVLLRYTTPYATPYVPSQNDFLIVSASSIPADVIIPTAFTAYIPIGGFTVDSMGGVGGIYSGARANIGVANMGNMNVPWRAL